MDCKECHERFRADKLIEDYCAEKRNRDRGCGGCMVSGGDDCIYRRTSDPCRLAANIILQISVSST